MTKFKDGLSYLPNNLRNLAVILDAYCMKVNEYESLFGIGGTVHLEGDH
uniref:Uncharacterized protein n=1 Tax=Lepeophtheirus salmonis TaxID=72036 RepID=A0A0K2UKK3_LEPSM